MASKPLIVLEEETMCDIGAYHDPSVRKEPGQQVGSARQEHRVTVTEAIVVERADPSADGERID
ncbi:hypothetical protein JCM4814A_03470 [Streptomyces phaeofaciens JCM 4814]